MYATKDDYYHRLDTAPSGMVYKFRGNKNFENAMSDQYIIGIFYSLDELKKEGYEIHRTLDGLSVGDVVVGKPTLRDFTVIHRSGYGDLSLVVVASNSTGQAVSNNTLKEIKEYHILKEPTPERCDKCGK